MQTRDVTFRILLPWNIPYTKHPLWMPNGVVNCIFKWLHHIAHSVAGISRVKINLSQSIDGYYCLVIGDY